MRAKELAVVSTLSDSDICGETGVTFLRDGVNVSIAADEEVTGEQFADEMSNFDFSGVQNFEKYMDLFIDFVSKRTNLYKRPTNNFVMNSTTFLIELYLSAPATLNTKRQHATTRMEMASTITSQSSLQKEHASLNHSSARSLINNRMK